MYIFQVIATDNGLPQLDATATATINIGDINDNAPIFTKKIFQAVIPETHTGRIMTISATDPDIDDSLSFELVGDANTFFSIRAEDRKIGSLVQTGILEVYKVSGVDHVTVHIC